MFQSTQTHRLRRFITKNRDEILKSDGAVLPGVGSFGDAMDTMTSYGINNTVIDFTKSGKTVFGNSAWVCSCFFPKVKKAPGQKVWDFLKVAITKIPSGDGLKIPHIGWNSLNIKKHDGLFKGITGQSVVYFVHSYYLNAADKNIVSAQTEYGGND